MNLIKGSHWLAITRLSLCESAWRRKSLTQKEVVRYLQDNIAATSRPGNGILSIVNIMYGLRDETWSSLWKILRQLQRMSPDFYNALHLTPLGWTSEGRAIDPTRIVQLDQRKWDYRQPVIQPECFPLEC